MKILKTLGLYLRDGGPTGKLVRVDDERFDPMWDACGRLGIPVAMHVGDPEAFFTPIDRFNERYEELGAHPDWSFYGKDFPAFKEILAARDRVFARHPKTTFVALHVGHWAENLAGVGEMLDKYRNVNVEIGARIGELGRQPRTSARFFDRYQDRVLFGTDAIPLGVETPQQVFGEDLYHIYYRFLETEDEYFDYAPARVPPQGRWRDLWSWSSGADPPEGVSPERRTSIGDEARRRMRVVLGILGIALVATLTDYTWYTLHVRHSVIAGVIDGAVMLTAVGAVLGLDAGRFWKGLPIGALAGVAGALVYYLLVALVDRRVYGSAIPAAWVTLWFILAVLDGRWLRAPVRRPWSSIAMRGVLAALFSGAGFYFVMNTLWGRPPVGGRNYFVQFAAWVIAWAPGLLALTIEQKRR